MNPAYNLILCSSQRIRLFSALSRAFLMKTTSTSAPSPLSRFLWDFAISLLVAPFALVLGAIAIALVALALM